MTEEPDLKEEGIGPYQTELFKQLEFTIDKVYNTAEGYRVLFMNGREAFIKYISIHEQTIGGDLRIILPKASYSDGETSDSLLSKDRVLFYLTKEGSYVSFS